MAVNITFGKPVSLVSLFHIVAEHPDLDVCLDLLVIAYSAVQAAQLWEKHFKYEFYPDGEDAPTVDDIKLIRLIKTIPVSGPPRPISWGFPDMEIIEH